MFTHHSVLFDLEAESTMRYFKQELLLRKNIFLQNTVQRIEAKRGLRNSQNPHIYVYIEGILLRVQLRFVDQSSLSYSFPIARSCNLSTAFCRADISVLLLFS